MSTDAAAPATPAPAAALPPLETVDGASLVATLPAVSERAVAALNASTPAETPGAPTPTPPAAPAVRRSPRTKAVFDPAIHRANPDGSPFRNARGALMPKAGPRGPRKPSTPPAEAPAMPAATPAATGSTVPTTFPGDKPTTPTPAAAAGPAVIVDPVQLEIVDATAEAYHRAGYLIADKLTGGKGEWQPDDAAEHEAFKAATVAWLRTRKAEPPSPFGAWLTACAAFIIGRVERVNTSKRLRRWFPWFYDDEPTAAGTPGTAPKTENAGPVKGETPAPTPQPVKTDSDPTAKFFGA